MVYFWAGPHESVGVAAWVVSRASGLAYWKRRPGQRNGDLEGAGLGVAAAQHGVQWFTFRDNRPRVDERYYKTVTILQVRRESTILRQESPIRLFFEDLGEPWR